MRCACSDVGVVSFGCCDLADFLIPSRGAGRDVFPDSVVGVHYQVYGVEVGKHCEEPIDWDGEEGEVRHIFVVFW